MKRRLVYLGAFLVMFLSIMLIPMTVEARDFQVDGIIYNDDIGSGACSLKGLDSSMQDVSFLSIPDEVSYEGSTYEVSQILSNAFSDYGGNIESIVVALLSA